MSRDQQGFTLLEIIVALAVLSLGFLTAVLLFSGGLRMASKSDKHFVATILAHSKFSELELAGFASEIREGTFENNKEFLWKWKSAPYERESDSLDEAPPIKKVTLRVVWLEGNDEKEVRLTSLRVMGKASPMTPEQMGFNQNSGNDLSPEASSLKDSGNGGNLGS